MTMPNPAKDIEAFGGFFHPVERPLPGGGTYSSGGITLRDWFAAQALAGIASRQSFHAIEGAAAREAYATADAMLAARAEQSAAQTDGTMK